MERHVWEHLGLRGADILLPKGCDLYKWAVVACDQFTSQPAYWRQAEEVVGDAPSALRLMLPEGELGAADVEGRIRRINAAMDDCLRREQFALHSDAMFYIERTQSDGLIRRGVLAAIDLEHYDFTPGSGALIRATEGTVMERIPPRVRVRENAPLELPHVMLLIDDGERRCIEPLTAERMEPLYDFKLMLGGGRLRGWRMTGEQQERFAAALSALIAPGVMGEKYGLPDAAPLLFAVGDGNHSLAAAKACYERQKRETADWQSLPSRYALAEIVNLHDRSLRFEAIHRVAFDVDPAHLLYSLHRFYPECHEGEGTGHLFSYAWARKTGVMTVPRPAMQLSVGTLQAFLDDYTARYGGRVDYIHGAAAAKELGRQPGNIGFCLDALKKGQLFKTVMAEGVLPRKTFSMVRAEDKRYYLEARRIRR